MKQVIVIRKDLNMRKGKMVAQGAHASMAAVLPYTQGGESQEAQYVREWLAGAFTKICVGVNNADELRLIFFAARAKNLPCSYIVDNGLTEFNGQPTPTAVAVGPGPDDLVNEICGELKLL